MENKKMPKVGDTITVECGMCGEVLTSKVTEIDELDEKYCICLNRACVECNSSWFSLDEIVEAKSTEEKLEEIIDYVGSLDGETSQHGWNIYLKHMFTENGNILTYGGEMINCFRIVIQDKRDTPTSLVALYVESNLENYTSLIDDVYSDFESDIEKFKEEKEKNNHCNCKCTKEGCKYCPNCGFKLHV